jgi:3-oxoacyl-[acyl-carrier protein] reductase
MLGPRLRVGLPSRLSPHIVQGVSVSEFGSLDGMRAVVTGSSSGIGRAIAIEFASAGADVVVHCNRSLDAAQEVAADIRSMGRLAAVVQGDIRNPSGYSELVDSAWRCFKSVDIWVNNAGVDLLTGDGPNLDYADKLSELLNGDVRSSILISRMVGERMSESGIGNILNIGWDQADQGMEGESGELFAAAKNSVMGFTRSLAMSLAPSVRVNCIAPGWIRTAWGDDASDVWQERVLNETPIGRWGIPEDIAKLARFLASPDAAYMTGQIVNCNGGAVR